MNASNNRLQVIKFQAGNPSDTNGASAVTGVVIKTEGMPKGYAVVAGANGVYYTKLPTGEVSYNGRPGDVGYCTDARTWGDLQNGRLGGLFDGFVVGRIQLAVRERAHLLPSQFGFDADSKVFEALASMPSIEVLEAGINAGLN